MSRSSPEENKALVTSFYEKALNDRNLSIVADFLAPYYRQHNPTIEDGVEGLKKYLRWIQETHPRSRSQILRVYADGDFVILHVHRVRTPGTEGDAIVDLFRLEGGKIAEHWDVIQPVPERAVNDNTMFY
jgi:predicted SnoaL-like aldol condensation-catalyzing enzyme